MARLSDICHLDGCDAPHHRRFSHIVDNRRYYFESEACQMEHIHRTRQKQFALRKEELERREYGSAHP